MRLFTGIPIPDAVKQSLARLLDKLRPAARLKWSPVANLHVTTKFIGEWPEARLGELESALVEVPVGGRLGIAIQGLGWYPNPHSPRVFWAGVRSGEGLQALAAAIDQRLAKLGIEPEARAFSPHLTLARIKDAVPLAGVRQAVASLDSVDFGAFEASHFHLYLSEPGAGGSVYKSLAQFPLSR